MTKASELRIRTRTAILIHAVQSWAARVARRDETRELLDAGAAYRVSGTISAGINGRVITQSFAGSLAIGHDTSRANPPRSDHVLALALASMSASRRKEFLAALPAALSQSGELPPANADQLAHARLLLKRCATVQPRRGNVTFTED